MKNANSEKKFKILLITLAALVAAIFVCIKIADSIQTCGGSVFVEMGKVQTDLGKITYKLYRPKTATAQSPAPAVLLLHGYQNDHETSAAYAVELARRGVVVMALDEYGHGSTSAGMIERGYTNHKVKVNYGCDSEADKTFVKIGGPERYKVMMNFSNLSFFNERYSRDAEGNSVKDSSMGGIAAYACLADFDFVDQSRLAVSGHSMGTWASWSVAAAYSGAKDSEGRDISPKAVVLQCGELFTNDVYDSEKIHFNNVLLLQAKYDEFNYFRDYENIVSEDLIKNSLRAGFLGCSQSDAKWNTTFGDFSNGTARRVELLNTNHRLATHNSHAMAAALKWFSSSLKIESNLSEKNQVFFAKEWLVFFAMIFGIAAMIPLMELLFLTPFFAPIASGIPDRPQKIKSGKKWAKSAAITILIAAFTYPFLTQLGHGLLPLPERSVFRMTIGNGFFCWYVFLILIMILTTAISWRKAKKSGDDIDFADLGLSLEKNAKKIDWALCGKSALLSLCMTGFLYLLVTLCEKIFLLDFRFIWPFFRSFTLPRLAQFFVYILFFAIFFVLNNSKIFAQGRVAQTQNAGAKAFFCCWWKYALCMVGGILLIVLLEYIPFFAGAGPGADLLFSPTFGGPFMSLLIVFAPQVVVFSVICTHCYRRTGSVYVGAFTVAILACWIVTGGSAIL